MNKLMGAITRTIKSCTYKYKSPNVRLSTNVEYYNPSAVDSYEHQRNRYYICTIDFIISKTKYFISLNEEYSTLKLIKLKIASIVELFDSEWFLNTISVITERVICDNELIEAEELKLVDMKIKSIVGENIFDFVITHNNISYSVLDIIDLYESEYEY